MTIYWLTMRQLLAGKRWVGLVVLSLIPPLISMMERGIANESVFLNAAYDPLVNGVLVPIVALLVAGPAIAGDIEDGTAVFVLAKPLSRISILLERMLAALSLVLLLVLSSGVVSLVLQRHRVQEFSSLLLAGVVSIAVGALVYTAIFMALSLVTRRGILLGLFYIILWENMLAGQFAGTRSLSVKEYMETIATTIDKSGLMEYASTLPVMNAVLMSLIVFVLATFFAAFRLGKYEIAEQA